MPAPASVFIETTIPSYYVARTPRQPVQAARQRATREWWDGHRRRYALFTSQAVLDEARQGEPAMAARRLGLLIDIPLLLPNEHTEGLTARLVRSGIVPPHMETDAGHLAIAGVFRIDFLLTWNLRHLANPALRGRLEACFSAARVQLPIICTPELLLTDENLADAPR